MNGMKYLKVLALDSTIIVLAQEILRKPLLEFPSKSVNTA